MSVDERNTQSVQAIATGASREGELCIKRGADAVSRGRLNEPQGETSVYLE
jgi:hypothetical protein